MNGHNFRGDWGLLSGTQPEPAFYAGLPYGRYDVDAVRDQAGDKLPRDANLNVNAIAPYVWWVSDIELLGANYGVFGTLPVLDNALEAPTLGIDARSGFGLGDLYLQPINLGWHLPQADFVAGFGVTTPTGRYEPDAKDNTGLGMWSANSRPGRRST